MTYWKLFPLPLFLILASIVAMAESKHSSSTTESITLGGGCFWCVEAVFQRVEGVVSVVSGYAGGRTENPTYSEVTSGRTGHAEVVQVAFDPGRITLESVLEVFWQAHDPTTLNRQGADVGTQYRSVIYHHNEEQRQVALASRARAAASLRDEIVTEIAPLDTFFRAEDYHQNYFNRNPEAGYCSYVIVPKLRKLGLEETDSIQP